MYTCILVVHILCSFSEYLCISVEGSVFPYRQSLTIRFSFFRSHPYSFLCTHSVPSSVGVRLFVYLGSPVVVSTYFCWGVEFFRIFGPVSDISTYFFVGG